MIDPAKLVKLPQNTLIGLNQALADKSKYTYMDKYVTFNTNAKFEYNLQLAEYAMYDIFSTLVHNSTYSGNVAICGGAVIQALTNNYGNEFRGPRIETDIDVYIYGNCDPVDVIEVIVRNLSRMYNDVSIVKTYNTITVTSKYRPVQIILKHFEGLSDVLAYFDLGCCMVAYNGKSIVTNTLGACALVNQINLFNNQIRTASYLHRIHKYIQRGFGFIIPGYISTAVDSCIWYKPPSGPSKTLRFCDDWINYEGSKESSYSEPVDYLRVGCGSWFCLTVNLKPDRKKTMKLWDQTPKRGSELNLINGMDTFDIRKSLENFKFKYNPGPYQLQGFIKSVTHRIINRFVSTRAIERKHCVISEEDDDSDDDTDNDEINEKRLNFDEPVLILSKDARN